MSYTLLGHTDTVTSLQLSPDNTTLLSNAHDSTVRTWDVRPFAPADRRMQTYDGAPTGQERNLFKASWDANGERIAAGSGDQSVAVWEARTGKLLHKLPGHRGAVNDVRFHPRDEPLRKCSLSLSPSYRATCQYVCESSCQSHRAVRAIMSLQDLGMPQIDVLGALAAPACTVRLATNPSTSFNSTAIETDHQANCPTVVSASSDRSLMVGELGK